MYTPSLVTPEERRLQEIDRSQAESAVWVARYELSRIKLELEVIETNRLERRREKGAPHKKRLVASCVAVAIVSVLLAGGGGYFIGHHAPLRPLTLTQSPVRDAREVVTPQHPSLAGTRDLVANPPADQASRTALLATTPDLSFRQRGAATGALIDGASPFAALTRVDSGQGAAALPVSGPVPFPSTPLPPGMILPGVTSPAGDGLPAAVPSATGSSLVVRATGTGSAGPGFMSRSIAPPPPPQVAAPVAPVALTPSPSPPRLSRSARKTDEVAGRARRELALASTKETKFQPNAAGVAALLAQAASARAKNDDKTVNASDGDRKMPEPVAAGSFKLMGVPTDNLVLIQLPYQKTVRPIRIGGVLPGGESLVEIDLKTGMVKTSTRTLKIPQ